MREYKFLLVLFFIFSSVYISCSKDNNIPQIEEQEEETSDFPKPASVDNNVVAHRGASKETGLPDNSLASLKAAINLGCFASECDIHATKDSQIVVFHDPVFKGKIIKDYTYEELAASGTLSNGEKLPLLEGFIDALLEPGTTILFVDVKSKDEKYGGDKWSIIAGQMASEIVHKKKAKNFVEFIVAREAVLVKCIEASHGDWNCGYMNRLADAEYFVSKGYNWANFTLSAFYQKSQVLKSFKEKNIRVSTYNADNEEQMKWFLSQEMYAICTNYASKMIELLKR